MKNPFVSSWFGALAMVFRYAESLVGHEDGWYVTIKAYKLAVFEILRDCFVLALIACMSYVSLQIESTDSDSDTLQLVL